MTVVKFTRYSKLRQERNVPFLYEAAYFSCGNLLGLVNGKELLSKGEQANTEIRPYNMLLKKGEIGIDYGVLPSILKITKHPDTTCKKQAKIEEKLLSDCKKERSSFLLLLKKRSAREDVGSKNP